MVYNAWLSLGLIKVKCGESKSILRERTQYSRKGGDRVEIGE